MEESDEELVSAAVARNDHQAFGRLVQRHQPRLRGWLLYLTRDATLADDLAQSTLVRAWERLETFSGSGSFGGWLMKIAQNVLIDEQRSRANSRRLRESLAHEHSGDVMGDQPALGLPDLPKMLSVLSQDERVALVLCHAFGCSHQEVSQVTGLPLGTVKSHVKRGTEKIRHRYRIASPTDE